MEKIMKEGKELKNCVFEFLMDLDIEFATD